MYQLKKVLGFVMALGAFITLGGESAFGQVFQYDSLYYVDAQGRVVSKQYQQSDADGNRILSATKRFDEESKIERGTRFEIGFDQNGNRNEEVVSVWDTVANQWVPDTKRNDVFHEKGKLLTSERYRWNQSSLEWEGEMMYQYTYSDTGELEIIEQFEWNDSQNDWLLIQKNQRTYNLTVNGSLSMELSQIWTPEENQWVNSYKREFSYQENGLKESVEGFLWLDGEWKENSRKEYEYDEDGKALSFTPYSWSDEQNEWIEQSHKVTYLYDADGHQIECVQHAWDGDLGEWREVYKGYFQYQYEDVMSQLEYQYWDRNTMSWVGSTKSLHHFVEDTIWVGRDNYTWNIETSEWELYTTSILYRDGEEFSSQPLSVEDELNQYQVSLYPNPTQGEWKVEFPESGTYTIELKNMAGEVIEQIEGNGNFYSGQLDVPAGVYILSLRTAGGQSIQKLVKQ